MKVRAPKRVHQSGAFTPEIHWRHYAENAVAPLCRKRNGSYTPKIHTYKEAYEEAQRIVRISDEVRISLELVDRDSEVGANEEEKLGKISTSKLAKKLGLKTDELVSKLLAGGYLEVGDGANRLAQKGASAGGEFIEKSRFGPYFQWPEDMKV